MRGQPGYLNRVPETDPETILLMDRQPDRRKTLAEALQAHGLTVMSVDDLRPARRLKPAIVIIDVDRPLENGTDESTRDGPMFEALRALRTEPSRPEIILYCASPEPLSTDLACRLLREGAHCLVESPDPTNLLPHLHQRLAARCRQTHPPSAEPDQDRHTPNIVWRGEAMRQVMEQVQRAAALSDITVLLTGETGTGKQLLAEAIHYGDQKRSRHPLIVINCASLPATLAESELFGHRRGAFTDAKTDRPGLFRAGDQGTVFLDEISELELSLQPKLLRALEAKQVRVLGQDAEVPVDVRVMAATNRDLRALVERGRFREDLYHRLNVVNIHIPPLSERSEDVPPLVEYFLKKHQPTSAVAVVGIDPRVLEVLSSTKFRGNVRELEKLIRRMLFHKKHGNRIELEDLPKPLQEQATGKAPTVNQKLLSENLLGLLVENHYSLNEALRHCEHLLLSAVRDSTHGPDQQAPALLKIARSTFYKKLIQHHLITPAYRRPPRA